MSIWCGWRVEIWWRLEQAAGALWRRFAGGRAAYWLGWLAGWAASHRYRAERRRNPELFMPETHRWWHL
jgi:hypothetical protein